MPTTQWSTATARRTRSRTFTSPDQGISPPPAHQTRPTRSLLCHCAGPSSSQRNGARSPAEGGRSEEVRMRLVVTMGIRQLPSRPRPLQELYREFLEESVLAEELGFDHVWASEHHFRSEEH